MNVIVLAGGFARRMWPLTREHPKHLLEVGGRPMLDYVLDKVFQMDRLSKVYLSTNFKFKEKFEDFLEHSKFGDRVDLFIEDSRAEEEKLGSIGALELLIREKGITGELLIIGGDNPRGYGFRNQAATGFQPTIAGPDDHRKQGYSSLFST